MTKKLTFSGLVLIAALLNAGGAYAGAFSSDWEDNPYARARLIAAEYPNKEQPDTANAGVQIELNPGWKTYWRVPGDSGIPPRIMWKGSKNVKSIEVRWPAPHRYIDEYGMSIGYKDEIVLPLKITPIDKTAPVHLSLQLDYAVCKEVCLPVNSKMTLKLTPAKNTKSPFGRKLKRFLAQVPKQAMPEAGLRIRGLEVVADNGRVTLKLDVENSTDDPLVDVFVEGRDDLFFGTPKPIKNTGKMSHVEMPVSGAKSANALDGDKIRLTMVGKKSSTTQYWQVGGVN